MSDDSMMSGSGTGEPMEAPAPLPAPPARSGPAVPRVVLIIIGAVVFLAILGAAAFFILNSFSGVQGNSGETQLTNPGTAPATSTVVTSGTILPIPSVTDRDIFTPRDPFGVIVPATEETTTAETSTETSGTLTLQDIVTENGTRKAVVRLNGKTYKLAAGSTVDSSPWSIVEVNSDNIVALYGDQRVTISLGQGTSK